MSSPDRPIINWIGSGPSQLEERVPMPNQDRIPTRAEVEEIRERDVRTGSPGLFPSVNDRHMLLARLEEAERLLRECADDMWDEEPLCAEIGRFLKSAALGNPDA